MPRQQRQVDPAEPVDRLWRPGYHRNESEGCNPADRHARVGAGPPARQPQAIQARGEARDRDDRGEGQRDLPRGTINSVLKQAGIRGAMRYAIVIEKSETGFGAYVPDLPGCVAAGETENDVLRLIREAAELHVESLRESGQTVPSPSHSVGYVEVSTPV